MKIHTTASEDYLKAILVLQKKSGMVRSVDVSRYMGVTRPSVSRAVSVLIDGGFLVMDEDFFLHLTDKGEKVAKTTYEKNCFFTNQLIALGVDSEAAKEDACRLEHAISDVSFQKLKACWNSGCLRA